MLRQAVNLTGKGGWLLASVVLAGVVSASAQTDAARRGQPILFSTPKSELVQSNLNALQSGSAKHSDLQRIEQDLRKPFDLFPTESSLDGVRTRIRPHLPPPAINSQKARELLDKKRNWIYMEDREIEGRDPTPEEVFGVDESDPETALRRQRTAMERYYHGRLERERAALTNAVSSSDTNNLLGATERQDPVTPIWLNQPGTGNSAQADPSGTEPASPSLSGLIESEKKNEEKSALADLARPRTISELMGFGGSPSLPPRPEVREARVNEFRQILGTDPRLTPTTGLAVDPFKGFNASSAPASAPLVRPGSPSLLTPPPNPGSAGSSPGFAPTMGSDFSRRSVMPEMAISGGLPSLSPNPPPPPAPRVTLPPTKFEAPRRAF